MWPRAGPKAGGIEVTLYGTGMQVQSSHHHHDYDYDDDYDDDNDGGDALRHRNAGTIISSSP